MKRKIRVKADLRGITKAMSGRTQDEAWKIHQDREERKTVEKPMSVAGWLRAGRNHPLPAHVYVIPLGRHSMPVPEVHRRKKNWESSEATVRKSFVAEIDNGKYSGRCTYTHWTYRHRVQSWGAAVNGHLFAKIDSADGVRSIHLRPWRGWRWEVDQNGIRLVSRDGKQDWHPTADQVLDGTTISIARLAREAAATRRAAAKEQANFRSLLRRAEQEGCQVCMADSLAAGNCRAGTTNWAKRHGLEANKHYQPSEVLALANGDMPRVRIVVAKALQRHLQEMRQGFADLAYHQER